MEVNVNQLVINALDLIGENEPNQTPAQVYINEGIKWLNLILAELANTGLYIPFFKTIEFTMVANQATYTISPTGTPDIVENQLASLDACGITWQGTYYPVDVREYDLIDYQTRNVNETNQPGFVIWQPGETIDEITFYDTPDQAYPTTLRVKQKLTSFSYGDNTSTIVPDTYLLFLTFAVAQMLSMVYPTSQWTPTHQGKLNEYMTRIGLRKKVNLVIQPTSLLSRPFGSYWNTNDLDVN
jgi:hypothetical protein